MRLALACATGIPRAPVGQPVSIRIDLPCGVTNSVPPPPCRSPRREAALPAAAAGIVAGAATSNAVASMRAGMLPCRMIVTGSPPAIGRLDCAYARPRSGRVVSTASYPASMRARQSLYTKNRRFRLRSAFAQRRPGIRGKARRHAPGSCPLTGVHLTMRINRGFAAAAALLTLSLLAGHSLSAPAAGGDARCTGACRPARALDLINKHCSGCHTTATVFSQRKSADDWAATVQLMVDRGADLKTGRARRRDRLSHEEFLRRAGRAQRRQRLRPAPCNPERSRKRKRAGPPTRSPLFYADAAPQPALFHERPAR